MNRTKIICTSGPSVDSIEKIEALVRNGMSILRINCSHGDHSQYLRTVRMVREVERLLKCTIPILIDLQGPKLRIGDLPHPFVLKTNEIWCFSVREKANEVEKIIPVSVAKLAQSVRPGDKIFLDDGLIDTKVVRRSKTSVWVKVIHGGELKSRKGINVPHFRAKLSCLTKKDRKDLNWGLRHQADYVALSFVRSAQDIIELKRLIAAKRPRNAPLVLAKIEKPEAVDQLEAIIRESDGVMIARGDLGIELKQEKVPVIQKQIIELSRHLKKPNIVATQMLDSMRQNPIPTRAEVSDVANTIFAGADAVLLTGETSSGSYPIQVCAMMKRIIMEVENHLVQRVFRKQPTDFNIEGYYETFMFNAMQMADDLQVKAIVMLTKNGHYIRVMSKFHPKRPMYCLAPTLYLARRLHLYWGTFPITISKVKVPSRIDEGISVLKKQKAVKRGDRLLFVFRDFQTEDLNIKVVQVE